ncbi:uncharacterized protein LOC116338390 [Contarinia nasturtii]|uniref:uncharacterized protein LOC116338390 n=1 Tax=Contarinia nasturtii TaxID=265458 RepID=UPI0012D3FA3C|nr:uncharacterized protein LOC116338390 [Contarinia nasturtii]
MKFILLLALSLSIFDQFKLVCSQNYTSKSPVYTSLINAFVSKTDAIRLSYDIRDRLTIVFKTKVYRKPDIVLSRLDMYESSSNSPNFDYFVQMYDKSGLPDLESIMYNIIGRGDDEVRRKMKGDIEYITKLRHDIRNFYNNIYKGLFVEPKFIEINGFQQAFEKFNKTPLKKAQEKKIKENIDFIGNAHSQIITSLSEKLSETPFSRLECSKQYDSSKNKLNAIKKSENDADMNDVSFSFLMDVSVFITELTTKLEAFKNDMSAASSVVDELTKARIQWLEIVMGVKIQAQNGGVRMSCCGAI